MEEATKMTNKSLPEDQETKIPQTKGRQFAAIIIIALFLIGTIQALTGSRGFVTTGINDDYLGVDGTYGDPVFLELASISNVQLVDPFDFGTCIEGEETKNTVSGTYSCSEYGTYSVHAYTDEPCIVVHSPSGILVFNCGSNSHTEDLYNQLANASGTNR